MTDEDMERIGRGLMECTLPKAEWTHSAHFAAALWMLARPEGAALPDLRAAICAYNEAIGGENTDTAGYHETITAASLIMARAHRAAHPAAPLHAQLASLLAGPCGRPDWILSYWTKARLFSPEARRGWVGPDLQPLPE
ncbi:MAG: hypothetical protein ACK4Y9_14825 [Hyphomonas sp.]